MEEVININENILIKSEKNNKKRKFVLESNGIKKELITVKLNDSLMCEYAFNYRYFTVYTMQLGIFNTLSEICLVYDIQNNCVVDLNNLNIKEYFKYLLITSKSYSLACVLELLNDGKIGLVDKKKLQDFIVFLTSNNKLIDNEIVKEYILRTYPKLNKYTNLLEMDIFDFQKILKEIGSSSFVFHKMEQSDDFINELEKGKILIK